MATPEVCRLCLKNENLIWVFDKSINCSKNMKEIVFTTTGVEILQKDMISQKICEKCHQISSKMYQFRQQSLKNDKYLKDQYKELLEKNKDITQSKVSSENRMEKLPVKDEVKEEPKKDVSVKPAYKIHPSITKLFKEYPQIKLPTVCLQKHIEPVVSMEMDAVEDYFKKLNLNFQKYTQLALKWDKKIAMKRTSTKTLMKTAPEEIKSNEMNNKSKSSNQSDPLHILPKPVASTSSASTPSEKEKIHPIAIKRNQEKDKSSYKIVNVSRIDKKSDEDSVKSSDDNSKPSTSKKRKHGKRKLSDSDLFSEPEAKKTSIIESVGLTPKKPVSEAGTLYVEKSVALFICSICNSVQYSEKGLKKHQEKHLRCQFCKAKFKTMDLKTDHVQSSCVIKNMMNDLPLIRLEKVEKNLTIREAYRKAFKDFPRIAERKQLNVAETPQLNVAETPQLNIAETPQLNVAETPQLNVAETPRDDLKTDASTKQSEIIEILSDDESNVKEEMPRNAVISESGNVTSTSNPIPITVTNTTTPLPSTSASSNVCLTSIQEMSISSSVVKPDIKIKNNNLLEILDPRAGDIRVVKELIVRYNNIKLEADSSTQTELPSSDSINVHKGDLTTELKYLKHLLYVYKVPVEIKEGSFNVEYSYQQAQKRQKKLDMWNDLVAVDVKYSIKMSVANGSAPVDKPKPKFRSVSAARNNHSSAVDSHIGNIDSTSTSTIIPLPAPKNSVIVSPVYDISDNIIPTIPQASNLEVSQIPRNVQEMSNIDSIPVALPNPTVGSFNASSPSLATNPTNSYPLSNSARNNSGVTQMQMLNDVGTAANSVASTVPSSETVSVPLAGTIRVKNVWELK